MYAQGIGAVVEQHPWSKAFEMCGLKGSAGVSKELLKRLGVECVVAAPPALPSADDLMAIFLRRTVISIDELFALPLKWSMPQHQVLVLPEKARLSVPARPPPPLPPPV